MAETLLRAQSIYKSFVGVQALKDVSFSIKRGEIHCLAGENGSGKSILMIISGVYTPDSDTQLMDISIQHHSDEAINGSRSFTRTLHLPQLTVMENCYKHRTGCKPQAVNGRESGGSRRSFAKSTSDRPGCICRIIVGRGADHRDSGSYHC